MKIHKSLDFADNAERIEKNVVDEYSVHLEDYESINDLIARSRRTKTKFVPETSENAVYDDFLDPDKLEEMSNQFAGETSETPQEPVMPEQSDGKQAQSGVEVETPQMQL